MCSFCVVLGVHVLKLVENLTGLSIQKSAKWWFPVAHPASAIVMAWVAEKLKDMISGVPLMTPQEHPSAEDVLNAEVKKLPCSVLVGH